MKKENLPGFNGLDAFAGALRFIGQHDNWRERWGSRFGALMPRLKLFAADAFGAAYGLDEQQKVVIFWAETGEMEALDITEAEFFGLIYDDPDNTISLKLFIDATAVLGRITLGQHFAFKVELALGGAPIVDNLLIMDADEHMRALGSIAQQIHDVPEGTRFKPQ